MTDDVKKSALSNLLLNNEMKSNRISELVSENDIQQSRIAALEAEVGRLKRENELIRARYIAGMCPLCGDEDLACQCLQESTHAE